jgi:hypothetical protein
MLTVLNCFTVYLQGQPGVSPEVFSRISSVLSDLQRGVEEIRGVEASTGSLFVRLFLGQVNVKVFSKADREVLRAEYEKFKDRTNWGKLTHSACVCLSNYNQRHALQAL